MGVPLLMALACIIPMAEEGEDFRPEVVTIEGGVVFLAPIGIGAVGDILLWCNK